MPVISFVSSKGGAGKSTSALLLATQLAQKGVGVTVIDGDPEQWIHRWGQSGNVPSNMNIIAKPISERFEDTILDVIDNASRTSPFVIVDLEGSANLVAPLAVSQSDLVIIPTQPSTMDAMSAAKAIKLVKQQERVARRSIPFSVLFTRTSSAIKSRIEKDIAEQMNGSDVPVFSTQILERNAYKSLFAYSTTLEGLPKTTYNISAAVDNARAFAVEVVSMFQSKKQRQGEDANNERKEAIV